MSDLHNFLLPFQFSNFLAWNHLAAVIVVVVIFSESDLEEVLMLQTTQVPTIGSTAVPRYSGFQGVLKCLPNVTSTSCFRCPRASKKGVKVANLS